MRTAVAKSNFDFKLAALEEYALQQIDKFGPELFSRYCQHSMKARRQVTWVSWTSPVFHNPAVHSAVLLSYACFTLKWKFMVLVPHEENWEIFETILSGVVSTDSPRITSLSSIILCRRNSILHSTGWWTHFHECANGSVKSLVPTLVVSVLLRTAAAS